MAQGDPSWNAVGIHVSYRCALPKPTHGTGIPKAVGDGLWGAPLLWAAWNHCRVKQSSAEVPTCQETILAGLESSLGLVMGFIDGRYFSVEALGCKLVFNVVFGKGCRNLKVLIDLSPHVPHTAHFKQRQKLLQSCESILYMRSENVMGNLHLEDIELGALEHKILLMCPPNSAFEGLMNQGVHTFPTEMPVLVPCKTHTIFPGTSRTGSLTWCYYLSKQGAEALPSHRGEWRHHCQHPWKGSLDLPDGSGVLLLPGGCQTLPSFMATKGHTVLEGAGGITLSLLRSTWVFLVGLEL